MQLKGLSRFLSTVKPTRKYVLLNVGNKNEGKGREEERKAHMKDRYSGRYNYLPNLSFCSSVYPVSFEFFIFSQSSKVLITKLSSIFLLT